MLIDLLHIEAFAQELKSAGKKIVFTNGCFDIIHPGHTRYLMQAKDLGDVLILGLNSDDSVRRLKGPERPLNNEDDRSEVLLALKAVDHVVVFTEDTPYNLIALIKPHVLAKGGDYLKENIIGSDIVVENGGEVVVIPFVPGKSTTTLIDKIRKL